jgi:hypothetical protein
MFAENRTPTGGEGMIDYTLAQILVVMISIVIAILFWVFLIGMLIGLGGLFDKELRLPGMIIFLVCLLLEGCVGAIWMTPERYLGWIFGI